MRDSERANEYADIIINGKYSIRETAKMCGVSKSTVHKYISEFTTGVIRKRRLRRQLNENSKDWHLKGGSATKAKYAKLRNVNGNH